MLVYTDSPDFARLLLQAGPVAPTAAARIPEASIEPLLDAFFDTPARNFETAAADPLWQIHLVSETAPSSQYARLLDLARRGNTLPHGLACTARDGGSFQGFRGRSWQGAPGNVQLSVHLAPNHSIERFESVFLVLAALSMIDAIDRIPELTGRAGIKWVNDILIDGAKVGGVIAYTQSRGTTVTSVVLGIGLNVEAMPAVAPTAFVPLTGALRDFVRAPEKVQLPQLLRHLLSALASNYRVLLENGARPLVERYRSRSVVVGEEVLLSSDDPDEIPRVFAAGRVLRIGDSLELWLDAGEEPIRRGRLIFGRPETLVSDASLYLGGRLQRRAS